MSLADLSLPELCGQLVLGGFAGPELSPSYEAELARGHRAGAILFRRNLVDAAQIVALTSAVARAVPRELPPFLGLDQEGGRVTRLPEPYLRLPAMRLFGMVDDLELTRRAAERVAAELCASGFNLNFAPVLDVDSNPENPVIGDRAFGAEPRMVMRHGVAFLRGLQEEGVLACGKHFPGHGDTAHDSHLELPVVERTREQLMRVELPPFRAAIGAGIACLMSAHVVYPALEAGVPATFSRSICAALLRREAGFEGVLFSDDLEMGAVAQRHSVEEAAVEAVWAGCDVVLICSDEDAQARAHEALVRRAEHDDRFRARCQDAATRSLRLRRLVPPRHGPGATRLVGSPASRQLAEEVAEATRKVLS